MIAGGGGCQEWPRFSEELETGGWKRPTENLKNPGDLRGSRLSLLRTRIGDI